MSSSGWDDTSDGRARSNRAGRPGDVDRLAGRGSDRSMRNGNPGPRMNDRMDRGSGRGWDESAGRSSSRADRPRDADWASSGSGRSSSRNQRGGSDYDRVPRERSAGRDADPRERSGDRSMRGPRPGSRDMEGRPRPGSPGGDRRPAPGRGGGVWGDDDMPRHRRPDGSDPRGRSSGKAPDPRDPRNVRRGLVNLEDDAADEEKSGSFGFGKAALIVLLMLLVGVGGAYGYYTFTAPAVHSTAAPANSTSATPSPATTTTASPAASATAHS